MRARKRVNLTSSPRVVAIAYAYECEVSGVFTDAVVCAVHDAVRDVVCAV